MDWNAQHNKDAKCPQIGIPANVTHMKLSKRFFITRDKIFFKCIKKGKGIRKLNFEQEE